MRLRSMLGRVRRTLLEKWFLHFDLVILCKTVRNPPPEHRGVALIEHPRDTAAAERLYRSLGRDLTLDRLQRRFEAGFRFFELRRAGRTVATTWAVPENERFVDELGIGIPAGNGILWLRDIFVVDSERGNGTFAVLLDEVQGRFPEARSLWSAVDRDHRASMNAHQRYGHLVAARYEVLHLFGRVMLRLRWPRELPLGSAFQQRGRVVLTGSRYRRFVLEHLA